MNDVLNDKSCQAIRDYALNLILKGQVTEAITMILQLIDFIQSEAGDNPTFLIQQQARCYVTLGCLYNQVGKPDSALVQLREAIVGIEALGKPEQLLLAEVFVQQAYALFIKQQFDQALLIANQALRIRRTLGTKQDIAISLGLMGDIQAGMHNYDNADKLYVQARKVAKQSGNLKLQGQILLFRGNLYYQQEKSGQAMAYYKEAHILFRKAGDITYEMIICELLGSAEYQRGNNAVAEEWFCQALHLAEQEQNLLQQANATRNLSVLYQNNAEQQTDKSRRTALLHQAIEFAERSLAIQLQLHDHRMTTICYLYLARLTSLLGDLVQTEHYLLEGVHVPESHTLPNIDQTYKELAYLAHKRGDPHTSSEWWSKFCIYQVEQMQQHDTGELPPLIEYEPLLRTIAAAARGDTTSKKKIEAEFPLMEAQDWVGIPQIVQRIWAGERDLVTLTEELGILFTTIVWRILYLIEHPDAPPLVEVDM